MKRTFHFKNAAKFLKYREDLVKKKRLGWEDSWATDKNWQRKTLNDVFVCKWCAGKMYAAEFRNGSLIMSCRTPLCPGNIDHEAKNIHELSKVDVRKLTNQYFFNSMLRF